MREGFYYIRNKKSRRERYVIRDDVAERMGFGVCCGCALHTVGSATEMLRISVPALALLLKTARRAVFFTQKPSRVRIPIIRKARYECTLLFLWRRGWDSNPCGFWPNGFQDRLVMTASIPLRID